MSDDENRSCGVVRVDLLVRSSFRCVKSWRDDAILVDGVLLKKRTVEEDEPWPSKVARPCSEDLYQRHKEFEISYKFDVAATQGLLD